MLPPLISIIAGYVEGRITYSLGDLNGYLSENIRESPMMLLRHRIHSIAGLSAVNFPKLWSLAIADSPSLITAQSSDLAPHKNLSAIELRNNGLQDLDIPQICKLLPQLRALILKGNPITEATKARMRKEWAACGKDPQDLLLNSGD